MRRLILLALLLGSRSCCLDAVAQHSGTVVGSPTFATAKFGNGMGPGGAANYVTLPTGTCNFTSTSSFSIEVWLADTSASPSTQVALSCGAASSSDDIWLGINASNGHFIVSVTGSGAFGGTIVDSGLAINDGSYHDCILAVSGGTSLATFCTTSSNVWATGATATGTFSGVTHTSGMVGNFAVAPTAGFSFFGGEDEVAFWNYAKAPAAGSAAPSSAYTGAETGLVALYHLQSDGTDSASGAASTPSTIDASNSGFLYSPYNWNVQTGGAKTINAGAYFRTIFSGTTAVLNFDMTNAAAPYPQLWCRIDDQNFVQSTIAATVSLATGLANRKHLLDCVVKSTSINLTRWSATAQAMVTFTGLTLDSSGTVSLPTGRSKRCLIFGDSITEGVRTINNSAGNDTDQDDVLGTYTYLLANGSDCEWGIVGLGGAGISVGGVGGVPALPASYGYLYSGVARSFTSPAPDLVVYNEGTNDGSANIVSAYTGVVNAILAAAPNSKHLLMRPFGGNEAANVQATVTAIASPNVTYVDTTGWFNTADSVDALHPYSYSSYGLMGPKLLTVVNAALAPKGRSNSFF